MNLFAGSKYLHHMAPVPVLKRVLTSADVSADLHAFNTILKEIAHDYFAKWQVQVPDEKHLCKSTIPKKVIEEFVEKKSFVQPNAPAEGKWHAVPTNNFLNIEEPEVKLLRNIVMQDYKTALETFLNSLETTQFDYTLQRLNKDYIHNMDESWIQFYVNGDYKVLHNHLRYGFDPKFQHIWAGGYYIQYGKPDPFQPYAGRFSFRLRDYNHYIKPQAGMIMLWPGDILHEVHPFYGEEERVCINFNLSMQQKQNA